MGSNRKYQLSLCAQHVAKTRRFWYFETEFRHSHCTLNSWTQPAHVCSVSFRCSTAKLRIFSELCSFSTLLFPTRLTRCCIWSLIGLNPKIECFHGGTHTLLGGFRVSVLMSSFIHTVCFTGQWQECVFDLKGVCWFSGTFQSISVGVPVNVSMLTYGSMQLARLLYPSLPWCAYSLCTIVSSQGRDFSIVCTDQ